MDRSAAVVVGIDYSPASELALQEAIRAARDWRVGVELVHALPPLGAPGLDLQHPQFDPVRNESADVSASLPEAPRQWLQRARAAGVPAWLVSRPGPPARVIVDEAKRLGARAIVVGSHGRGGVGRAVLGSVAEQVVESSPVPVLVVPPGPPAPPVPPGRF